MKSHQSQVSVLAEVTDRGGGIGRIEWRVNGVTVDVGNPPASIEQVVRLTRSVALDPGDNEITVIAYNSANLIASTPSTVNVTSQDDASFTDPDARQLPSDAVPVPIVTHGRLFVLAVGVNAYADKRIALDNAVADATEVGRAFAATNGLYQSVDIKLLTDADVTGEKLDAAFREIGGKAQASDAFVFYLAGHGKTIDGRYYFAPQDLVIDGDLSEQSIIMAMLKNGISQDRLQRWLAAVPARRSLILFDTCDSGTLTGEAGQTQELERSAANDRLSQATGRSIITAAAGSQEAQEGYRGHGLFTYQMLDAFQRADSDNNGAIEVSELAAYVYAQVIDLSQKVFRQRQIPQMKITANYTLTNQMRILKDDTIPVAGQLPTHQTANFSELHAQPADGAAVVRSLSSRTAVTVLENRDGWSLLATNGRPIGYVATRELEPLQRK